MTIRLRISILLLVLSATGFAGSAGADETMNAALDNFDKGVILFNSGKFQAAADTFRKAYELKPSWKLLFNIGQSEAAAKRYGLALECFEQFLSEGGDEIEETRRDAVLTEVVRLRKMVGYLKVAAPEGAVIFIDNVQRATAPVHTLLPISAGINHEVRGDRDGATFYSESFKVIGSQTMEVNMVASGTTATVVEMTAPKPVEKTEIAKTSSTKETSNPAEIKTESEKKKGFPLIPVGWAVSSTGAATAISGGIVGGIALSKNNALAEQCKDTGCPDRTSDKNKYQTMANVATGLLAGGGTVLATGIALLIVGKVTKKKEAPAISAAIFTDGEGGTAAVSVRF